MKQGDKELIKVFDCKVCGYETNDIMDMTYHELFNCEVIENV